MGYSRKEEITRLRQEHMEAKVAKTQGKHSTHYLR